MSIKSTLTGKDFWIGVIVGAVVVPYAMGKFNTTVRVPAAQSA